MEENTLARSRELSLNLSTEALGSHNTRVAAMRPLLGSKRLQGAKGTISTCGNNTVYIGTILFVVVCVFTIGAVWRPGQGQPRFISKPNTILGTLSRHANKLLPSFLKSSPMNVIFIVADDLGWNDIGYRNNDFTTPNLDNLARNGVILNQSYVQSTCSPSRTAILTGYYPHKIGLQHRTITYDQAKFIPLDVPTLAEKLKSRGYATHAIGKWHVGHCNWNYTPINRGFDSHFGYFLAAGDYYSRKYKGIFDLWNNSVPAVTHTGLYSTDMYGKIAEHVIYQHANSRTEPLFMYLAFQAIHGPLNQPPEQYLSSRKEIKEGKMKSGRYTVRSMALALDAAIGRLIRVLKETGMMENTLLIFTSDNGGALESWGDNSPLRGGKFSQWEGGTRANTFIHGSMIKQPGRVFNGLFHAVDWMPTILAAVDSQLNSGTAQNIRSDGVNQWNMLVENKVGPVRKEIVYLFDEVDETYVYRYGQYKLIVGTPVCSKFMKLVTGASGPDANCWYDSYKERRGDACKYTLSDTMLFDIKNDPTERYDISQQKPEIVSILKRRIEELKKDMVPNQSGDSVDVSKSIINNILYPGWC